ncbi:MAG: 30S ribosome-binding factor RbfA [Prevotella sp.]|jgi:ribosome-binding factor A|nr:MULTISPECIES: 30S ribosome-binding factor RbfA [unclassified Prevotella]MCH3970641.1 30S ribosome-binding factor RbfA [Prevotella sp.]MCH3984981.1 30S ribosome-binding factor RbfA [Prevotella sp.]MCH3991556.1 30S ribosome-binding factor RbfA [Prevotella sp.]MCH4018730.1 30S ribosome-binding factor RbfA [Prevotella sp.]MCH4100117.1 30S ribosome-binding factor RbfA [Prevotella sp.]
MRETRQNRIARLLQKELATLFQEQTRRTHGILISVTNVKISPDMSVCTAYLSIFPSEKADDIVKNIRTNEKTIRYSLGTRVGKQLRIIPELRFFLDDTLDYQQHIDDILQEK